MSSNEQSAGQVNPGPSLVVFGGVLALALAVFYGDVLLLGRSFFYRDFSLFGYPLAVFHRESFWLGEVPLWNPYSVCGMPFVGQWNSLVLYPGSLLYLLLPMPWAVSFYCLLHLWWGGVGMYVWVARTLHSRLGAGVAGMAFGLGGLMINSLMWPNNIAALGWMPWVAYAVELAWRRGGKWIAVAVVVGGVQMLTGAPEILIFTWGILGVLCLGDRAGCWSAWLKQVGRLALVGVLVALVAAPQLLPFLHALEHSHRMDEFKRSGWSMAWTGWANLFLPLFRGIINKSGVMFQARQYWTNTYYVGIGSLFMFLVVLARVRDRRAWLFTGLSLLAMLLALGEKAYLLPALEKVLFPLKMVRFPIKYVVTAAICLPVVAAYGTRWFISKAASPRDVRRLTWLFGGLIGVVCFTLVYVQHATPRNLESWDAVLQNAWTRVALLIGLLALVIRFRGAPARSRPVVGFAILALLAVDQLSHEPNQNPSAPRWMLEPVIEATGDMQPVPKLGESRAMTENNATLRVNYGDTEDMYDVFLVGRLALSGNANLIDGIPKTQGFFSLYPAEANLMRYIGAAFTNVVDCPFYDLQGLSQITEPGTDLEWIPRETALPLVTVGQGPVFTDKDGMIAEMMLPDYRPDEVVLVPEEEEATLQAQRDEMAQVPGWELSRQWIRATVEASEPVLLRVSTSYDPNWRATVDGVEARVLRVDLGLLAVEVPPGRHDVVLRYWDDGLVWGGLASLAVLLVCASWMRSGRPVVRKGIGAA